jgi:hypothetical protein
VETNETFTVTLSNPSNATLGTPNPATVTIIDNDLPIAQFSSPTYSVNENAGPAIITVTLSVASPVVVSVDYATSDGTATSNSDYTLSNGTLTFNPGQTVLTFTVAITDDVITNELSETVTLTLSNPSNATLGAPNPATLTIVDDDGQPEVAFITSDFGVNEGDDGGTGVVTATIVTTLSMPSALTVTVSYSATNGTAVAPGDYTATTGILTFAPGQTSQSFNIQVISDTISETIETVLLALSNPVSATLGTPATATLTIVDDDNPGWGGCVGAIPAGEPNEGAPDNIIADIACGAVITVTLTTPLVADGNNDFDLVYYERGVIPPPVPTQIQMDWVVVQVSTSPSGPWFTIFYWGDYIDDTNTNINYLLYNENNNEPINVSDLYGSPPYQTGITIDIDARAPAGTYPYVRIYSPFNPGNDSAQVDALEVLP